MNPMFAAVYELLLSQGPAHFRSARGTVYRIEARGDRIIAFPKSGRINVHQDCWGHQTTCQGTRAGGIYNGPYSIFDWFAEHQSVVVLARAFDGSAADKGASRTEETLLDEHAPSHVATYNAQCLHYNLIAEGVYRARRRIGDPLSPEFEPYIIAGLMGFDMGRTMGKGEVYSLEAGFGGRLHGCLNSVQADLKQLSRAGNLLVADLAKYGSVVERVYAVLASAGTLGAGKNFHVGATKVLHWLFPDLLVMVDQNVARAFRHYLAVKFKDTTQPGYCCQKYVECPQKAQEEICRFGPSRFTTLDQTGTPVARIFDKIAFIRGANLPKPTDLTPPV